MLNKRGQEGITLGTLLIIILGGVALVVIILGFTGAWGFIFSKIGLLPGQSVQALAESCKISVDLEFVDDYCSFKEVRIEGETGKQWLNCEYGSIAAILESKLANPCNTYKNVLYTAKGKCDALKDAVVTGETWDAKKVKVNGKTCEELGVESITAESIKAAAEKAEAETEEGEEAAE